MDKVKKNIKEKLIRHLNDFFSDQDEENLSRTYELGRFAIDRGIGVLEMLDLYHETIRELNIQRIDNKSQKQIELAADFLTECLAPYEMKEKGYEELIKKLRKQNSKLQCEVEKREQTQKDLKISKEHFQQLIENALDIITVLNHDGTIRYLSPSIETILGYTADEMVGKSVFEYIHTGDWKHVREKLQAISEKTGNEISVQFRIEHKNGNYCYLKSNARNVSDALGAPGIIVNSRNVTAQVTAFDKLEKNREQLRKAQKIARLGSWEWNINKRELHWSGELCDIYGIPSEDQPKSYSEFLELIPEDDRESLIKLIRKKYRERGDFEFEHRVVLPDGQEKILLARGDVVTNDAGAPIKMIGTGQDVTKIKRTERKLRAYSEQLKNLTEKKERIRENERIRIARKLHDELGQMLTVLKLDLYMLQQKINPESHQQKTRNNGDSENRSDSLISELKSAIERVDTITTSVQRISTELRPPILDDLGLNEAIEWQLNEFQNHTGIQTTFQSHTGSISDLSSEESTAIFRILQESLTNIIRHADASHVEVELSEMEEYIQLKVRDDGIGIQWDKVNQTKSLGILGMRERSEFLGGDVAFVGGEEKGTTVILTIPRIKKVIHATPVD